MQMLLGLRAFPGAEGAGAMARGGRGGKALFVLGYANSVPKNSTLKETSLHE